MINKLKLTSKKYDGCMLTVSGVVVDLYNPNPDIILIEDIAHGLAYNCRWNGHTQKFWSVSQHCCMMFDLASPKDKLKCLFHDAEEAYWGDMIRPLKNKLKQTCPEVIVLMEQMRKMIFDKFEIEYIDEKVKKWDIELLQWEFENVVEKECSFSWLPRQAKEEWLKRYKIIKEWLKRYKTIKEKIDLETEEKIIIDHIVKHNPIKQYRIKARIKSILKAKNIIKMKTANDLCQCGHKRKYHLVSHSINYTEGSCTKCKCKHFLIK